MSNTILTPQVISNELLRRFKNNLGFLGVIHTENYSDKYGKEGAKIGDTYNLRDPVRFAATEGATLILQDVEERKIPLVINQRRLTAFSFDSQEMTLSIDQVGDRYVNSAAVTLANSAEVYALSQAYQQTPNFVGVPGAGAPTGTTGFLTYLQAFEALDRNSAPMDGERSVVIGPKFQTGIIDALKGLFQSSEQIKRQYVKGRMGTGAGFDWIMAQNIRTATGGLISGGVAILVNGAGQSGSSLNINGMTVSTAGVFNAGDVFTIGNSAATNVYALNPVSLDALSDMRQFTILNTVNSDVNGAATINIYPPIAVVGDPQKPNPYATCSIIPASGATINAWTGIVPSVVSPQSLAFHKEAYAWACVPMVLPTSTETSARAVDKQTGVSIRMVKVYDGVNDLFFWRCEIMFGFVAPRKDWGCRIAA